MMFFGDGQFPKCAVHLRTKIIGSVSPRVYKALVRCIRSEELVKQALAPGTYPRLMIEPLKSGMFQIGGIYQGMCYEHKKNYIYVNIPIANKFEFFSDDLTPPRFERILLHELVHWGRFIAGKSPDIRGKEAGGVFEHLAYGSATYGDHEIKCPNRV